MNRQSIHPSRRHLPAFAVLLFTVMLCAATRAHGTDPTNRYVVLKPSDPTDRWEVTHLEPMQQANYTVDVIRVEGSYRYVTSGVDRIESNIGADLMWTVTRPQPPPGMAARFKCHVVNTEWIKGQAVVGITCLWERVAAPGPGPGPGREQLDLISGWATGIVNAASYLDLSPNPTNICIRAPAFTVSAWLLQAPDVLDNRRPEACRWSLAPAANGTIANPIGTAVSVTAVTQGLLSVTAETLRGVPPTTASVGVPVLKVDIAQTNVYHCAMSEAPVTFYLTNSYLGSGTVRWTGGPPNQWLGDGDPLTFTVPTNWPPGVHTITARSTQLTNCLDTATLTLVKVEFTEFDHVCTTAVHRCSHEVTVTVTPSPLGTNIVLELRPHSGTGEAVFTSNNSSTETITGTTNLTVLGTEASSAVSNMVMEARLGNCVCTQAFFTVVDTVKFTATDAGNANTTTNDTTQADDTNTIFLCQGTNGTAAATFELEWEPADYPADEFLWEIIPTGGSTGTVEWDGTRGAFDTANPFSRTWDIARAAAGATNREFRLRAWFDCNGNTTFDADEPHRIIDVVVIKVELEPITVEGGLPPDNSCGIEINHSVKYTVKVDPATFPDSDIVWSKVSGDVDFVGGDKGRTVTVKGNATGDFNLDVDIHGVLTPKPYKRGKVLDKKAVDVFVHIVRKDDGTSPATTPEAFSALLEEANKIFEQVAIEFKQVGNVIHIDKTDWLDVETTADNWAEYMQLQSYSKNTGGIEIYCIDDLNGFAGVNYSPNSATAGLTIDNSANSRTLAHELGHACGLNDINDFSDDGLVSLPDEKVKESWLPDDWSGGSGSGYYNRVLNQKDLIRRLIMYGTTEPSKADFSLGKVHGLDRFNNAGQINVGLSGMGDRQPAHW